jgi:hypothetical protein
MAAVPIAPVAHLLDSRAVACGGLDASRNVAHWRGLTRCRQKGHGDGNYRHGEGLGISHRSISLLLAGAHFLSAARRPARR